MQHKIEVSEKNARESQKQAMISRLFAEAIKENDIDKEIDLYNKILRLNSDETDALINRAISYYKAKLYSEALKDASAVIELASNKPAGYAIRGMIYSELHLYEKSIQDCTTAISIAPKDVRTYATRANAYLEFEKWEDAINDYDKILEFNDLTPEQYNNRAYCYYKLGRLDIAMGDVEVSLKKMEHASAYDTRGCIYMAMGKDNYQMALEDFTKAISMAPKAWICYENRANLYKRLSEDETDEIKKSEYIELYKKDLEIFRTKTLAKDKIEEREQTKNGTK